MDNSDQIQILRDIGDAPPFAEKIGQASEGPIRASGIDVLQMNIGRMCNLRCRHCHLDSGPDRTESMPLDVMKRCMQVVKDHAIPTIDITGGAPELNPHISWLISNAGGLGKRVILRTNLVLLLEPGFRHLIDLFVPNGVEIVASLPNYVEKSSDRQRGPGIFRKAIEAIKLLNARGYGRDASGRILDLVHNPVGAFLPGPQAVLELEYRARLFKEHGIEFNRLFCITNLPIGRYLEYLVESENYEDYMSDLYRAFNPVAVDKLMCKSMVSVGFDGTLYDCDFNQALGLAIDHQAIENIMNFDYAKLINRRIVIYNHCYGCCAGSGSSCQGQLNDG